MSLISNDRLIIARFEGGTVTPLSEGPLDNFDLLARRARPVLCETGASDFQPRYPSV